MNFNARILRDGQIQRVQVPAENLAQARAHLQAQGVKIITIQESKKLQFSGMSWFSRKKQFALGLFVQELVVLLDAGLVLVESIETLRDKAAPGLARQVLSNLLEAMYQGHAFSKAMGLQPAIFPKLLIATVSSSEQSGQLSLALQRYHQFEAHVEAIKKRVSSALMYPLVVLSVGALILVFLLFFVIPRFSVVFDSMSNLPMTARIMVWWGDIVANHAGILMIGVLMLIISIVMILRTATVKYHLSELFWRIPSLKEQRHLFILARFYRTIGMLLMGGLSAVSAIAMTKNLLPVARHNDVNDAIEQISSGQSMSIALVKNNLTTPVAERLLRVGEQSGELAAMCERIAQFHDEALARAIEVFSKVFEPLLMLLVGGLIGLIVFLLYMPIFELAGSIQ